MTWARARESNLANGVTLPETSRMKTRSPESVPVMIHPTHFPQAVEEAMKTSLRARQMNHQFHYDSHKKGLRWMRLHEAHSPARTDSNVEEIYKQLFHAVAEAVEAAGAFEIVSLGCGGGQKDCRLLRCLGESFPGVRRGYVGADVGLGLSLVAREAALSEGVAPGDARCFVIDLGSTENWRAALQPLLDGRPARRIFCFFGMLPNFSPVDVLPRLRSLLSPDDVLLVSANLAPGNDYAAAVHRIMPQYDNALTREWLLTVLQDLGIETQADGLHYSVAPCPDETPLQRIEAVYTFGSPARVEFGGETFSFTAGDPIRLFYSYRYTVSSIRELFEGHGMEARGEFVSASGEEGVWMMTLKEAVRPTCGAPR